MFIYLITNTRNGKRYVGQSKTPQKRWAWHRSMFRHRDASLYRAMRKHGIESFTFEIVVCALAAEFVSTLEIELIRRFDAYSNGYNSTLGGEGIRGCPQSEQTKEKIAASKRGKARSPETVEKMRIAATGRPCSVAAREKLPNRDDGSRRLRYYTAEDFSRSQRKDNQRRTQASSSPSLDRSNADRRDPAQTLGSTNREEA